MRTITNVAIALLLLIAPAQAQTCPTPAQLDTDLTAASQAATISLSGINPLNCPEVSMAQTWGGGKLIFSDSPESPTTRGKLYEDTALATTSGTDYNRVFLYHVNGKASGKMRFAVLIKNTSGSSATLTTQKKGTSGPSTSYLYAGKLGFERWLNSTAGSGVSVGAGVTVRLDSTFDALKANPSNLLHGIWDYSMTQTHQVTICALDENDVALTVCPGLSVLSRDSHQRGTFQNADKVYDTASGVQVDTVDGVQQFPLGGNTTNDTAAVGTDATDGSSQTLAGNYGVLYKIHLNTKATDGQNLGTLINPRGGAWGGAIWMVAGLLAGGKFLIPPTTGSNSDNTKASVAGRHSPGASFTIWYQFMPTGGSALPLRHVLVPH
jgi:hypothetical protein